MTISSLSDLEERYASMTSEEFAALCRANLTEEAQAAYDKEVARRKTPEWLAREAQKEEQYAKGALAERPYREQLRRASGRWGLLLTVIIVLVLFTGRRRSNVEVFIQSGGAVGLGYALGWLIALFTTRRQRM